MVFQQRKTEKKVRACVCVFKKCRADSSCALVHQFSAQTARTLERSLMMMPRQKDGHKECSNSSDRSSCIQSQPSKGGEHFRVGLYRKQKESQLSTMLQAVCVCVCVCVCEVLVCWQKLPLDICAATGLHNKCEQKKS